MAHRNISKIILYPNGLIVCRDPAGRQSPPLQGMFWDIIDNLKKNFGPEEVAWCVIRNSEVIELPFEEWFQFGNNIERKPLEVREVTNEFDGLPKSE